MKKRALLTLLAMPLLTGCFDNYKPKSVNNPETLSASIVDQPNQFYTKVNYTISFSCSPRDKNWMIYYVLDDDGGTGLKLNSESIYVDDKVSFYASYPGTARFHFKFDDHVSTDVFEIDFINEEVDVSTPDEFLHALDRSSSGVTINVKNDLDFTGVKYTPTASFSGKINGENHTISNINRLTTTKNDCLSLVKNFTGTLEGLNFKDCKFDIVAECSRIAVFAATSSGTIKDVMIDNIQIDSNLVSTVGSLVGYVEGGTYENITAKNLKIKGKKIVGGIFGDCTVIKATTLKNITASGNIELYYNTEKYVGGVASAVINDSDKNKNGRITVVNVMTTSGYVGQAYEFTGGVIGFARNCDISFTSGFDNSNLRVLGAYSVGGLYGHAKNCTITDAANRAVVKTGFNASSRGIAAVGGIAGQATNCDLTRCKNYGLLESLSETAEPQGVGGIVGWANGDESSRGSYYYLENYGSIEGRNADGVAGIIGRLTANCNRTVGFVTVDVDFIRAKNCCGSIIGYVEINGTFSLNNGTFKYNECTYNKGHCSSKDQAAYEPAIGGFSYYNYGTAKIQTNDIVDLNQ